MPNSFGEAFKQAVEKGGKKDLSQYTVNDLFPPTTAELNYNPERGDLAAAIEALKNREENDNGSKQ